MDKWEARDRKVSKKRDRKDMNRGYQNNGPKKAEKPRVTENRRIQDIDWDDIPSLE